MSSEHSLIVHDIVTKSFRTKADNEIKVTFIRTKDSWEFQSAQIECQDIEWATWRPLSKWEFDEIYGLDRATEEMCAL